jgi:MarR family transcriptional regulator for hemolysin
VETLAFMIIDLARLFRQEFEQGVADAGLAITAGEARTLLYLSRSEGMRQSALAERMHIEPMSLSNFVDRLEARRLVVREPDPDDRRAKRLALTPAAAPLLEQVNVIAAAITAEAVMGISEADARTLAERLGLMRSNLADGADRGSGAGE